MGDPGGRVPVVLVVAGHRVDAVACVQAGERRDVGRELGDATVDEVAGQHDQIGADRVGAIGDPLRERLAERRADVDIGQVRDQVALDPEARQHDAHPADDRTALRVPQAVEHGDRDREDRDQRGGACVDREDLREQRAEQQVHGGPEPGVREPQQRRRGLSRDVAHHDRREGQARCEADQRAGRDRVPRRGERRCADEAPPDVVVRGAEDAEDDDQAGPEAAEHARVLPRTAVTGSPATDRAVLADSLWVAGVGSHTMGEECP